MVAAPLVPTMQMTAWEVHTPQCDGLLMQMTYLSMQSTPASRQGHAGLWHLHDVTK